MAKAIFAAVLACAVTAQAQTGVRYKLEAVSSLDAEFCTGPCLCPGFHQIGPLSGTFTLTLAEQGPLFDEYRVTSVDLGASIPFAALRFIGSGRYRIGGEVALTHSMILDLSENGAKPVHYDSGVVIVDPLRPFPRIGIEVPSDIFGCRQNTLTIYAAPVDCYADCDGSGQLNVLDYSCFLNLFAASDAYANCDGSTVAPVLNVQDFACFLNRFAAGCT
jgi:hypothetical protein